MTKKEKLVLLRQIAIEKGIFITQEECKDKFIGKEEKIKPGNNPYVNYRRLKKD